MDISAACAGPWLTHAAGAGEEYLEGSGAVEPFAAPELQALQSASQAVSSMAAQQVLPPQPSLAYTAVECPTW